MPPSDKQPLKPAASAADDPRSKPARRRGWRVFFSVFKWCRVAVLLVLLSALVLGIFLNRVGLPAWVKQRIVVQMRKVGWEIEFSRMRLRWYRGIVAEDLQFRRTNDAPGPHLFLETAEFRLNLQALRHFDLHADSVMVQDGRLFWSLPGTNQPNRTVALNDIRGEMFLHPTDTWELRSLQATFLGARVRLRGNLTNALFIREWKLPEAKPPKPGEEPGEIWKRIFTDLHRFRVLGQPELNAIFALDARDLRGREANFRLTTRGLDSPWGGGEGVQIMARLLPQLHTNDQLRAELKINADAAHTPWATGTNLQLALTVEPSLTHWVPTNTAVVAQLRNVRSRWGQASHARLSLQSQPGLTNVGLRATRFHFFAEEAQTEWAGANRAEVRGLVYHPSTNLLPAFVETDAQFFQTRTRWATSEWAHVAARFPLPEESDVFFKTNLAWPARLQNVPVEAVTSVSNLTASRLVLASGILSNHWKSPQLASTLSVRAGASDAAIDAGLNLETRELTFALTSHLSPGEAAPWIPRDAPRWFTDFDWHSPLDLEARGRVNLPAWTNVPPGWMSELWPSSSVAGRLELGEGAYRQASFTGVTGLFRYTNFLWSASSAVIRRPEGTLEVDASGNQQSGDFRGHLRSTIDLMALRPCFPPKPAENIFRMFEFTVPPSIVAEASGNWGDFSKFSAAAEASVTNMAFREQSLKSASARVAYTNGFLSITKPLALREGERGEADGIGIDLVKQRLYLTNAFGNLHPMVVARAIGDQVVTALEPYLFDVPPQSRVNGEVPITRSDGSEKMSFSIAGDRFHWRNLHLERVQALILWEGRDLTLTNLQGLWHGGGVEGSAHFDFSQPRGGQFSFQTVVDGADLKAVVMDAQRGRTNRIEGTFGGELVISQAYCNDLGSWFGYGRAYLRDGLLWDIPIFGVFSQMLNGIVPGLGNSRAKQGVATFQITNSIIYSKDVEIRATAMRMQYDGSLDFDTRVNARMEAELFRDTPGLGIVISKLFWPVTKLFEYRITGTIGDPKAEPLWGIPRVIFFPFQPVKTLKDIFRIPDKKPASAPPAIEPPAPKTEPTK